MSLTAFQRGVCRVLAESRIASGERYLAGGATLNELLAAPRISRDVDVFHDTESALEASVQGDRELLERQGYAVRPFRERPAFVEAEVSRDGDSVLLQWVRDSAYRFFPLVEHPELGLTLHPFDLATNKVLALVGRLEVRDFIDVIETSERLQAFGYLAWAACGKDPGFSPAAILEHASRSGHYSQLEVNALAFSGSAPDAAVLGRRFRALLAEGREIIGALPPERVGHCVVDSQGLLFRGDIEALRSALANRAVGFHAGSIRGALPSIAERRTD